jgi:hypothetical protein
MILTGRVKVTRTSQKFILPQFIALGEARMKELKKEGQLSMMQRKHSLKARGRTEKKIEELEFKISQIEITINSTRTSLESKKREAGLVGVEIANQKAKMERAKKVCLHFSKSLGPLSGSERRLIEATLKLQCSREKLNVSGIRQPSFQAALAIFQEELNWKYVVLF